MKKVAILGPNLESPGGVNVVIHHLVSYFRSKNIEVHLFPVGQTKVKQNKFIHPINSNNKKEQIKLFNEKIIEFKFDLIIANNLRTSFLLSEYSKKNKVNDVYVIHQGRILQQKFNWFLFKQRIKFKKIFENKKVIFLNNCSKESFLKKYHVNLKPYVIPNPFDLVEIRKKATEFKIKGNYILGVGRLEKNKNFSYLLKAYALSNIKEELWLLGSGEEEKNLKKLAEKLNIENKVKFLGWQNNPFPYIKNAKLLVHPSKFESFGNVIIEALILKTPVIATDIKCGPKEILVDKLREFLVPLNDENLLANKIIKALNEYPEIKDEYIERYKVESVGNEYLQFL